MHVEMFGAEGLEDLLVALGRRGRQQPPADHQQLGDAAGVVLAQVEAVELGVEEDAAGELDEDGHQDDDDDPADQSFGQRVIRIRPARPWL